MSTPAALPTVAPLSSLISDILYVLEGDYSLQVDKLSGSLHLLYENRERPEAITARQLAIIHQEIRDLRGEVILAASYLREELAEEEDAESREMLEMAARSVPRIDALVDPEIPASVASIPRPSLRAQSEQEILAQIEAAQQAGAEAQKKVGRTRRELAQTRRDINAFHRQHTGEADSAEWWDGLTGADALIQTRDALVADLSLALAELAGAQEAEHQANLHLERLRAAQAAAAEAAAARAAEPKVELLPDPPGGYGYKWEPRGARPEQLTFVHLGDWEGVYLNGRLLTEGHSISGRDLAEALGMTVLHEDPPSEEYCFQKGQLPARLEDLAATR